MILKPKYIKMLRICLVVLRTFGQDCLKIAIYYFPRKMHLALYKILALMNYSA